MYKIFTSFFSLFAVACLLSCGSDSGQNINEQDSAEMENASPAVEVDVINYALPSPLQVAGIFKKSGLAFMEGITNPEENLSRYTSSFSKSVGLGMYSADLSYCVVNNKSQPSISYMKLCRNLATEIGIGSVFETNNLGTRFESNIGNEDSIASIIAELQMETDMYLENNEQEHIASVIFSGAWIEAMYIGSKIYEKSRDKKLLEKIVEQITILDNIMNVLKKYESKDPEITVLLAELGSLHKVYNNLKSVKKGTANPDNEEPVELSAEEAGTLSAKIETLRAKFSNS